MAREVVVFCPYWIVNKTNTTLRIRDVSPCSSVTSTASPMADDGTAKPVLFRYFGNLRLTYLGKSQNDPSYCSSAGQVYLCDQLAITKILLL